MKLRYALLLALGVAVPVWIRQWRYERSVNAEFQRFVTAILEAHGEHVEIVRDEVQALADRLARIEGGGS